MKWEMVKLGDRFKTSSGGTPSRAIPGYYNGTYCWVKSGDLNYNEIFNTDEKITKEAIENSSAKLFPKGTLLVAMYGATIGKLAFLGVEAATNQAVCGVFDNEKDSLKYLFYYILFKQNDLIKTGMGGAQPNISQEIIRNLLIPLPPLPVQRAIAGRLDRADALRQKDRQLLRAYDELAQSVFVEMFGDPVRNEKGWEMKQIKDVVKNHDSQRIPVKESDRQKLHGEYPYYGATGIIDYVNQFIYDGKYLLIAEDGKNLLFRKRKNAFIVKGKFWVNNHAHVLSFDGKAELEFLEFYLNQIDLKPYVTGIDQFKLTRTDLDRIAVFVPPLPLQTRFATILANIERQKDLVRRQQAESEALFGRLLQEAFGG
jgi:type I restriction enzyme S subunit